MYYVQNNSYADLPTLASSGTMNITRTSRDGYTYSVDTSDNGFTVTARYSPPASGYACGDRAATLPNLHRRPNHGDSRGRLNAALAVLRARSAGACAKITVRCTPISSI